MKIAPRWLRRLEISLWYVGIALVGVALGATFDRWQYQAQQERALFAVASGVGDNLPRETPRRDPVPELIGPVQPAGPPKPAVAPPPEKTQRAEAAPEPAPPRRKEKAFDPSAFGRIEIPRLGVAAIIRDGADEKTLARAVGLVPGAAHPGETGNVVLAGHRDTFFRPLRKIKVNDRIRVVVPPNAYEYRVDSLRIVNPEETSVLESKGFEELTLVTCYPFRFIGPAPDRFIVSATRVN
ncbi:MAG TPA: class D sortase [Thermoanaerobaculia bacterium]|nr:class D sortase [Thermoanaerobaculia bacterium]